MDTVPPKRPSGGTGAVVAVVVIVLILAIGGLYYLAEQIPALTNSTAAAGSSY